jgi:hypothetical protein
MKKILIGLLILLFIAGGAGAVYYFFFYLNPSESDEADEPMVEVSESAAFEEDLQPIPFTEYFVISPGVEVFAKPTFESQVVGKTELREVVKVYEERNRWSRVQSWVNETTGKSQWIYNEHLSLENPGDTVQERYRDIKQLIVRTDDFEQHEARFIELTDQVLQSQQCSQSDLEQLQGWIRSFNYPDEPIYYSYCGGLDVEDKLYINLDNGDIFR